jgi:hypothetical protein
MFSLFAEPFSAWFNRQPYAPFVAVGLFFQYAFAL